MYDSTAYGIVLLIAVLIFGGFGVFLYSKRIQKRAKTQKTGRVAAAAQNVGGVRRRVTGGGAGNRVDRQARLAARMRHTDSDEEGLDSVNQSFIQQREEPGIVVASDTTDRRDIEDGDDDAQAKRKMGAKKAAKLADKERRKEEREAEERFREHQRKREDEEIKKRKLAEEAIEKAELEKEAAEARRQELEKARAQAEYERLAAQFAVEEEGESAPKLDANAEAELVTRFAETVRAAKLISVEHLAMLFQIKTDTCIERLRGMLANGQLTGVLDDRGKFLFVSPDEFEAVACFVERRGRVGLAELTDAGARLIRTVTIETDATSIA